MKHILVVDDDTSILDLVRRALSGGYRVSVAHEGHEALAISRDLHQLDLVITDYLMPSMQGDELLGRLREQWPAVKALILTGHGDVLARENASWWEAETSLNKPFLLDDLRAAVSRLIGEGEPWDNET